MNKIFKIIWSKARNCYVVVSELAKSHDDGHVRRSRSGCCRKAAVLAAFVLTTSLAVVPVWAADSQGNITNNEASTMTGSNTTNQSKNSVIYGSGNAVDDSENAVVVGKDNKAKTNSVVIGNGAQSNATDQIVIGKGKANGDAIGSIVIGNSEAIANTSQSVIIGNNTKANGSGQGIIVMGNGAMADNYAAGYTDNGKYIPAGIVLGEYSYSNTRAGKVGYLNDKKGNIPSSAFTDEYWNAVWKATANPMAIGNADTDANGKGEGHNGHGVLTRQITGVAAGTDLTDAVNVAQLQAAMAQFSSGGSGTSGDGVHYYSVRSDEQGPGSNYDNTGAKGKNSLAAGVSASTTENAENAVAIGYKAKADGKGATVIGQYASATGEYAMAFGGASESAMSPEKNIASGLDSLAFGQGTRATEKYSTAFGQRTIASGAKATAFGQDTIASGQQATAFGNQTLANTYGSTAFGNRSSALGNYATSFGNYTVAAGTNSLAFGMDTVAGAVQDAAGAYTNKLNNEKMDAFGNLAYTSADGKTYSVTYQLPTGGETHKYVVLKGKDGKAYIRDYHGDIHTVAIGEDGKISVGEIVKDNGSKWTDDKMQKASTDGNGYQVAGVDNATAWGESSIASGEASTAFGIGSTAAAKNSLAALGGKVAESAENAVAIGNGAQANLADSVALGSGSVASRARYRDLTVEAEKAAYAKGNSHGVAWEATDNAIAIGNDNTVTRQLTGVAAGSLDTDAVNVAQLKAVQKKVTDAHTTVSVGGQKAQKDDEEVKGGNLILTRTQDADTHAYNYDVKLGNDITVGEKGADGKDGKIGVNGKDGSSVVINGKDGTIGLNGKDGTNGLTIRGAAGKPGVDGKDGITRIVYKDAAGKDHPVATLDDGLKFKGDTGDVISKKLNDTLTIKGGQTDLSKLSTGKNVGVINENGALRIELAKKIDLGDEGSVKMGDTIINNNGLTIKNGPTITKTNVSMHNQQIHHVAAGKKGTDAVNVDQLNEVQTLASKHTKVTVEGGTAPKGTTYVGKNLKINVTDNKGQKTYDLKLADNLSIGEKGADGKDGKIGVNGKDGSSVVINGKDGTIGLNGKNGTNGLTIRGAAGKPGVDGKDGITRIVYKDADGKDHPVATLDDGLKFKGDDGTVISKKLNQRMDIVGGANKNNLSENNIGVISDNGKLHVKLAKDLKGLTSVTTTDGNGNTTVQNGKGVTVKDGQNNTATFTAKDITFTNRDKSRKTKLDEDGLTIFTKGASGQANQTIKITNTYISMGGQQIHNVLAGKADTDAVNVSQLKAVQSVAEAHSTVSVGGKKAGKDSVDVKGGNLVLKRTENTNGSKNYDVKLADDISIKSVTTTDDKGNKTVQKGSGITTIDKDGNKTSVTGKGVTTVDKDGNKTSLTGKGMTTVDKDGNKTSVTGKGVSISGKDGNKTTITEKGLTIKGGPVVTKDKFSAGGQQIHDVKDGTAPTDAVNVSQLKDEIGKVEQHHTEVTVNGGTEAQEGTYNTSGNLQIKKTTDKDGKKTYDLKLADNLTFGAKDGTDGKDGVDGSIGVKGKNGSAVVINGKDGSIGLNGADGKNGLTIKGADGTVGVDGKAGTTRLIYETKDGEKTVKHEVATMDDGMKYSGDSGNAAVKLNKNVQIYGGATEYADGNNIGVVASQDGDNAKLQVKLAKDLKGINSIEANTITTGNTTINNGGLTIKTSDDSRTITVQDGNVNMGGNTISGVADGKVSKDSTDAVNGSQLWQRDQAINGLSGSVNKLGNRINRVGAGAAALAALHPLDFDPDDKWDFAAGYGNYRGANAAAIGAYYRPNEDTMFSVGGSFGGGENMVNAGVSIKLGQGNHVSTSRVAMAKEMKAMRQHMAEQDALIAKLQSMHGMAVDPTKSTLFPDVAENHWAYQYVTTLAKKGILEGYPDGEFKGERMMTRYEFAAIVYRIVESGVGSTDPELSKLVKEFSPELQYIRIDTIQKDRNGKPTIERVRVISDAK